MVKALFLGLLAATMCGFARAAPAPQPDQPSRREETTPPPQPQAPLEDPAARSERSTNLSHVTGINRKIQMIVKNRNLQLLPDGTVNGTTDDFSPYTIFQKTAVDVGQLKIQGVTTCQYLCMNSCGLLYGSMKFVNECIFNENIEPHNYNTYTSTLYSDGRRTLYLALNRRGQPRKVQLRAHQSQGNVTTYIRVLTRTVSPERLTTLLHPVRHHAHMCPTTPQSKGHPPSPTANRPADSPRCRKRRKRKKKKRKCPPDGEHDTELCHKRRTTSNHRKLQPNRLVKHCENEDSDECQRVVTVNKKKHKTNISDNKLLGGPKKKKYGKKGAKKRHHVITSTEVATTAAEDVTHDHDEDYGLDSTTHWDWEDSTAIPDMSMSISMSMPGAPTSAQPD